MPAASRRQDIPVINAERAVVIRFQLKMIERGVRCFGSALDALDRGAGMASEQLERDGHDGIQAAFTAAPELQRLLPHLWLQVQTQAPLQEEGFTIARNVRSARRKLARWQARPAS